MLIYFGLNLLSWFFYVCVFIPFFLSLFYSFELFKSVYYSGFPSTSLSVIHSFIIPLVVTVQFPKYFELLEFTMSWHFYHFLVNYIIYYTFPCFVICCHVF